MSNDRPHSFPCSLAENFLVATSANRGPFVPRTGVLEGDAFRFFFCPRDGLFRYRFPGLGGVLDLGRVVRYYLCLVEFMCFSNFWPDRRFIDDGICVSCFVHLLRCSVEGALLSLGTGRILRRLIWSFCVLGVGYHGCASANVRCVRGVLPAFFVLATFSVNVDRFIGSGGFEVGARG